MFDVGDLVLIDDQVRIPKAWNESLPSLIRLTLYAAPVRARVWVVLHYIPPSRWTRGHRT